MPYREWTVTSLLKRVDDLEHALKPMAELARAFEVRTSETRVVSTALADLTVGHLRKARAVLEAGD